MKVIIKNLDKKCSEYIECTHIKIDDQRLMFIGNRVTSLLIPKKALIKLRLLRICKKNS